MKIYMVRMDNGGKYEREETNVKAFWSKPDAIAFMQQIDVEARRALIRIDELDKISSVRELTGTENREYGKLSDIWSYYNRGGSNESSVWIEEIDVY